MSIVVLADENIPALEAILGTAVEVRRFSGRHLEPPLLDGVDALLVRSVTPVGEQQLRETGVRFVGTATSGIEHVDREYLKHAGIAFAYAPASNANSVVEYVLTAIAAIGERLESLLAGGRVGIVGCGHVGRALALRLQSLGIEYCCYDPWLETKQVESAAQLEEVLACDVISLHCELTTREPWPSHHLIGENELRAMSGRSLLINAARGSVVDNSALARCLADNSAPETVLDVWEGEPDISAPLLQQVVLGTAHIAGYSLDAKVRATQMIAAALAQTFSLPLPPATHTLSSPEVLAPREGSGKARLIRELLSAAYDIGRDDALLRGAIAGPSHLEARENFDLLRRNYRERRELQGRRVLGDQLDAAARTLVTALGCRLVGGGTSA